MNDHLTGLNKNNLTSLVDSGESLSYKDLCKRLNIEYIAMGGSKNSQLIQLDSIVEYHKRGTRYEMIRFREPEEKLLYERRSEYIPYIELILSELLKDNTLNEDSERVVFLSTMELLDYCNMVNNNYKVIKSETAFNKAAIASINNFHMSELNIFVDVTYNSILKPIITTALKNMDNKKSIVLNKGYKAYYKSGTWSEYENILSTSTKGRVLSSIEADAFTELDIKDSKDLFLKGGTVVKQYYALCNNKCKEILGYDGFFNCYALVINKNRINYNVRRLQGELNDKIKHRVLTSKSLDLLSNTSRKVFTEAMIEDDTRFDFKEDIDMFEANVKNSLR